VLIIAHRLATVIDADRILVMHEGKALEFDYPFKLLANLDTDEKVTRRDGFLSKMVLSNGEKNA
jgi:ABC-type transport system involved in Fe-S cluster assembly fused permease/ATPase subunit